MTVQVIFEMMSGINRGNGISHLQELDLSKLPKLKKIWSEEPEETMKNGTTTRFSNLRLIGVMFCEDLEYLFPFFIALDVQPQVQAIILGGEKKMVAIVDSKKQGPNKDNTIKFRFQQLRFIGLLELPQLKTFYAGNHGLSFASLMGLEVNNCPNLKLFEMQYMNDQPSIVDDKLHASLQRQQPLFKAEEVRTTYIYIVL